MFFNGFSCLFSRMYLRKSWILLLKCLVVVIGLDFKKLYCFFYDRFLMFLFERFFFCCWVRILIVLVYFRFVVDKVRNYVYGLSCFIILSKL